MQHLIVGTAGHIDHGKSALVRALTGIDPDRLKEEKLRGITIDLGFAHLDLGDLQIGFVDVPGHEKFVKNMLAGVGGIDFVLLVVAADESIMPQTREHFDICRLLGTKAGIVVITKSDMVDGEMIELVRDEITELVQGSFLQGAEIIPVSSKTGDGLPELKEAIRKLARSIPERPTDRVLRLPIDRAFSIRGFGTVVTGTLTTGTVQKDQEIELIPAGIRARVRGIQVHGLLSDRAVAGQRTAVNLQGVDLAQVERGMVLTIPNRFHATQVLDAQINLLPSARPMRNLVKVRFHHGTSEVLARVALLGRDTLSPGDSGPAQLRLDSPIFCLHGDPFILRQFSPTITIGGGTVLHPRPAKHRATDKNAIGALEKLRGDNLSEKIPVMISTHAERAMTVAELNSLLGLPDAQLKKICTDLAGSGKVLLVQAPIPILILPKVLDELEAETLSRLSEFHEASPLLRGISKEELRKRVYDDLPPEVFRFSLDRLVTKKKIALQDEMVSLYGRAVQLSSEGLQIKARIEDCFRRSGYQPPLLSELPGMVTGDADEVRKIYFWMIKEKILIKISEDLAYLQSTLEDIKAKIRASYAPGSSFGVAQFKELFDLTRKYAIPLLEHLDRDRVTRRQGNERILR